MPAKIAASLCRLKDAVASLSEAEQSQIAPSLRHLKEAATHLSEAQQAIAATDKAAAAKIERLLQLVRGEIATLALMVSPNYPKN